MTEQDIRDHIRNISEAIKTDDPNRAAESAIQLATQLFVDINRIANAIEKKS